MSYASRVLNGGSAFLISKVTHFVSIETPPPPTPKKIKKTKVLKEKPLSHKSKRQRIWEQTNGHCWYCGIPLTLSETTVDHVIPISKNGTHKIDNLVASCASCNNAKGDETLEQYREKVTRGIVDRVLFTRNQVIWLQSHGFQGSIPVLIFYGEKS